MKLNKQEIDNYVQNTINDNKLNKINNVYLSNEQIRVLNKYNIRYQNVIDIKELIFKVEEFINENHLYQDLNDLENLSQKLSEFNYYYNTYK